MAIENYFFDQFGRDLLQMQHLHGLRSMLYYSVLHVWENVARLWESVGKRHSLYDAVTRGREKN